MAAHDADVRQPVYRSQINLGNDDRVFALGRTITLARSKRKPAESAASGGVAQEKPQLTDHRFPGWRDRDSEDG
jgi:hypothetical protein